MFRYSQYDVFISHNSIDKSAVLELAKHLESHGLKVWLDLWELRPGHPFQEALEQIIETTHAAAVLVGSDGLGPWETREMRACLEEFVKRGLPVIPVLLMGCSKQPILPLLLRAFTWVDFRTGLYEENIQRLVWGITGLRLEEPKTVKVADVDHQNSYSTWGAVLVMALLTVLFFYKSDSRPQQPATSLPEIEMIELLGGEFMMGYDNTEMPDKHPDEIPYHRVKVNPFLIGKYEVSQEQWRLVMGDNPSYFNKCGEDCPVENISFVSVERFIKALNQQTGKHFRLPTEAEWEYACRSGGKIQEYCGGNDPDAVAWYADNADEKPYNKGKKQANELGLCDLSGNVWEWTCSVYTEHYDNISEINCADREARKDRVIRGGSWLNERVEVRSGNRSKYPINRLSHIIGIRLAHDI